jgi:hypothetical protein
MNPAATFALAAAIAAGSAFALVAGTPDPRIASTDERQVCATDGLPGSAWSRAHRVVARRPVPGHQLDHVIPLCLGGADTPANIQVEPLPEALRKDDLERAICIAVCRDHWMSLSEGQAIFLSGAWRARLR